MPLVRIDLPAGKPDDYRSGIADAVHTALVDVLNVPAQDRFQIITEHHREALIIDRTYLGIDRSDDALIITITLNEGRTTAMKKRFYDTVATRLAERVGIRREDVTIALTEVKKENWSFGDGQAQYAD